MLRCRLHLAVAALLVSSSGCLNSLSLTPPVPFELTPEEQAALEDVLQKREQKNADLKSFSCDFVRWQYDLVFGEEGKPRHVDQGGLKFVAPDRGEFRIRGERAERLAFDGKTLWEYNYGSKQLTEIASQANVVDFCWLPLVFSTDAEELDKRYSMRIITPDDRADEIWLEAVPRRAEDACFFKRVKLILNSRNLMIRAVQVDDPTGKNPVVYALYNMVRNDPALLGDGVMGPKTPPGWKKTTVTWPPSELPQDRPH